MVASKQDQARELMLASLEAFIRIVHPQRVLGQCHKELIRWWTRQEAKSHQLVLLPRDHQKSALVAYRVAWEITKNPAIRVLYISSTSKLANKQLKFIKDILTSDIYRYYWPEMVNIDESKREKWTEFEISVDHPERKRQIVRDPTVFIAGLTTGIVGMHCDIAVLDDVVVDDNAYSEQGRDKVKAQASYLASIAGTDSRFWAVGTRYHPKDYYNDMSNMVVELFDDDGEVKESYNLFEIYERAVEEHGVFLWPRVKSPSLNKWFGFNAEELARKKAQYQDVTRFRAQYYNDPNDVSTASITPDMFQYFNRSLVHQENGKWLYKNSKINIFAAIDFAYSLRKEADFTAIVVVGIDAKNNYYVLEIDRFKTDRISVYYDHILRLHTKWGFHKLKAEVTAAQSVIVQDLKENYIRVHGLALSVEEFRPSVREGAKAERIEAALQPRYANRQVWHFSGGNCETLEEELIYQNPQHDDIKDCLASCIESCIPPSTLSHSYNKQEQSYHFKFGGYGGTADRYS